MLLLNKTAPLAVGLLSEYLTIASSSLPASLLMFCPPDLTSVCLVHWRRLEVNIESQHRERGQERIGLNWGERWDGRAGLLGFAGSQLLDRLRVSCCSDRALSLFAPQVSGECAGKGAGMLLGWHGMPDGHGANKLHLLLSVLMLRSALQLKKKKKLVKQDKDIIYCERKPLPSHRKHVASHALAETSGWPNLIKYSFCGFPASCCDGSWHQSPKAFDRDICSCWVLLLFQHPP